MAKDRAAENASSHDRTRRHSRLRSGQILDHLEDLTRLRIDVFREWPYLYEGSEEYERGYRPTPRLKAVFHWQEPGQASPVSHQLSFWLREVA